MYREIAGKYFGTEINEKWWKRYMKNKMFARGNGTFSLDKQSISFLRLLTRVPIVIDFKRIKAFKIGKWHAGQWGAGRPVIKVLWEKDNQLLSSGFSLSMETDEIEKFLLEMNERVKSALG
jgi:hypothetical protein